MLLKSQNSYLIRWGITLLLTFTSSTWAYDAAVESWKARIAANGGTVSQATLEQADLFVARLRQGGVLKRLYRVNLFAGDSLKAAAVPLINTPPAAVSFPPLDNLSGFQPSDYAERQGNGGLSASNGKFVDTGVPARLIWLNGVMSIYAGDLAHENEGYIGVATDNSGIVIYGLSQIGQPAKAVRKGLFAEGPPAVFNPNDGDTDGFYGGVFDTAGGIAFYKNGSRLSYFQGSSDANEAPEATLRVGTVGSANFTSSTLRAKSYILGEGLIADEYAVLFQAVDEFNRGLGRGFPAVADPAFSNSGNALTIDFEVAEGYDEGSASSQPGTLPTPGTQWKVSSSTVSEEVKGGVAKRGSRALRYANNIGQDGIQLRSPTVKFAAGETGTRAFVGDGPVAVAVHNQFVQDFWFRTVSQNPEQGLDVTISMNDGAFNRMTRFDLQEFDGKINAYWTYYDRTATDANDRSKFPRGSGDTSYDPKFPQALVQSSLVCGDWYHVRIVADFYDGPANDLVKVYLGQAEVLTEEHLKLVSTTYEEYWRDGGPPGSGITSPSAVNQFAVRSKHAVPTPAEAQGVFIDSLLMTSSKRDPSPATTDNLKITFNPDQGYVAGTSGEQKSISKQPVTTPGNQWAVAVNENNNPNSPNRGPFDEEVIAGRGRDASQAFRWSNSRQSLAGVKGFTTPRIFPAGEVGSVDTSGNQATRNRFTHDFWFRTAGEFVEEGIFQNLSANPGSGGRMTRVLFQTVKVNGVPKLNLYAQNAVHHLYFNAIASRQLDPLTADLVALPSPIGTSLKALIERVKEGVVAPHEIVQTLQNALLLIEANTTIADQVSASLRQVLDFLDEDFTNHGNTLFPLTPIAEGITPGKWYHVKVVADFVNGANNDRVRHYFGDTEELTEADLKATTPSWENYYRGGSETQPNVPPAVGGLISSIRRTTAEPPAPKFMHGLILDDLTLVTEFVPENLTGLQVTEQVGNEAPTFELTSTREVTGGGNSLTVENFVSNITAGSTKDNLTQTVTVSIASDRSGFFSGDGPTLTLSQSGAGINAVAQRREMMAGTLNAALQYTVAAGAKGQAIVTVTVTDDGQSALGSNKTIKTFRVVAPGTAPAITWSPANLQFPQPLGAAQLNASAANVAGTFVYTPPAGSYLSVGTGRELKAVFTPNDPDLTAVTTTRTINVLPTDNVEMFTFTDSTTIAIPGASTDRKASQYPLEIEVNDDTPGAAIEDISVVLNKFGHSYPADVGVMLRSPSGKAVVLMRRAGGDTAIPESGINLTFANSPGARDLDQFVALSTGVYKPMDFDFAFEGPFPTEDGAILTYKDDLTDLVGEGVKGTWSLYVMDSAPEIDSGMLTSWTLNLKYRGNTAPLISSTEYSVTEGATLEVSVADGLLMGAGDGEGAALRVDVPNIVLPARGTLTVQTNGSFTYVHDGGEVTQEFFTYRVTDGLRFSEPATVRLAINPVNDAPVVETPFLDVIMDENESKVLNLIELAKATDPDGFVQGSDGQGGTNYFITIDKTYPAAAQSGVVSDITEQTLTYTPDLDLNSDDSPEGRAFLFNYRLKDSEGAASEPFTVRLTVRKANSTPITKNLTLNVDEDVALTLTPQEAGYDPDFDMTTHQPGNESLFFSQDPANYSVPGGSIAIRSDGKLLTFTPTAQSNSVLHPAAGAFKIVFALKDGPGADGNVKVSARRECNVVVNAVQDAPTTTSVTENVNEDTAVITDVLANSADLDQETLTIVESGTSQPIVIDESGVEVITPSRGTVSVVTDSGKQKIQFIPTADLNKDNSANTTQPFFRVKYFVTDGTEQAAGFITYDVTSVDDAPRAVNKTESASEGAAREVDLDTYLLDKADDPNPAPYTVTLVGTPVNGTVTVAGNKFTFTPSGDLNSSTVPAKTFSFDYKVKQNSGPTAESQGKISFLVGQVNDAPVAMPDTFTGYKDFTSTFDVISNDSDVEVTQGESPSSSLVLVASKTGFAGIAGRSRFNSSTAAVRIVNNKIEYTPRAGYVGTDSFQYAITDGELESSVVTVSVNVQNATPPPPGGSQGPETGTPGEEPSEESSPLVNGFIDPVGYVLTMQGGQRGQYYEAQWTDDLINWTTFGSGTPVEGKLIFIDSSADHATKKFYRVIPVSVRLLGL